MYLLTRCIRQHKNTTIIQEFHLLFEVGYFSSVFAATHRLNHSMKSKVKLTRPQITCPITFMSYKKQTKTNTREINYHFKFAPCK